MPLEQGQRAFADRAEADHDGANSVEPVQDGSIHIESTHTTKTARLTPARGHGERYDGFA
jgi:hypothetical protein